MNSTTLLDIKKDTEKIRTTLEQKYWKNPGIIISGFLAIFSGILIAYFDMGKWLYLKCPFIHKWTHSEYNGAGYWIFAVTIIITLLGIPADKPNKGSPKNLTVDILLGFFVCLLVIYVFIFAVDLEVCRRSTYFKSREIYLKHHYGSGFDASEWMIPGIEIATQLDCPAFQKGNVFDFCVEHQAVKLKLMIRFCKDEVDGSLLSPAFISTNQKLFELIVDQKIARLREIIDKDGNPGILTLANHIQRYDRLSGDSRDFVDWNFQEFIRGVDPDPDILDMMVFLYYLDTVWGNAGIELKEITLAKIKKSQ